MPIKLLQRLRNNASDASSQGSPPRQRRRQEDSPFGADGVNGVSAYGESLASASTSSLVYPSSPRLPMPSLAGPEVELDYQPERPSLHSNRRLNLTKVDSVADSRTCGKSEDRSMSAQRYVKPEQSDSMGRKSHQASQGRSPMPKATILPAKGSASSSPQTKQSRIAFDNGDRPHIAELNRFNDTQSRVSESSAALHRAHDSFSSTQSFTSATRGASFSIPNRQANGHGFSQNGTSPSKRREASGESDLSPRFSTMTLGTSPSSKSTRSTAPRPHTSSGSQQVSPTKNRSQNAAPRQRVARPTTATTKEDMRRQADYDIERIAVHLCPPPTGLDASAFDERVELIKGLERCYAGEQDRKNGRLCLEAGKVIEAIEIYVQNMLLEMIERREVHREGIESVRLQEAFTEARQLCGLPPRSSSFTLFSNLPFARGPSMESFGSLASSARFPGRDRILTPSSFGSQSRPSHEFSQQGSNPGHGNSPTPSVSSKSIGSIKNPTRSRPGTGNSALLASPSVNRFGSATATGSASVMPVTGGFVGHSLSPAPRRRGGGRRPTTAPERPAELQNSAEPTAAANMALDSPMRREFGAQKSNGIGKVSGGSPWGGHAAFSTSPSGGDLDGFGGGATPWQGVSRLPSNTISKKASALSIVRELSATHDGYMNAQYHPGPEDSDEQDDDDSSILSVDDEDDEELLQTQLEQAIVPSRRIHSIKKGSENRVSGATSTSMAMHFAGLTNEKQSAHASAGTSPASSSGETYATNCTSAATTPSSLLGVQSGKRIDHVLCAASVSSRLQGNTAVAGSKRSAPGHDQKFGLGIDM